MKNDPKITQPEQDVVPPQEEDQVLVPTPEESEPMSEADREFTAETAQLKENSKLKKYISSLLSGSILSREQASKIYPYALFIAFLMFVYISNNLQMQRMHRREDSLKAQINELRAKSVTLTSIRMNNTRQSEVIKELERRGIDLKEAVTPSKVIED